MDTCKSCPEHLPFNSLKMLWISVILKYFFISNINKNLNSAWVSKNYFLISKIIFLISEVQPFDIKIFFSNISKSIFLYIKYDFLISENISKLLKQNIYHSDTYVYTIHNLFVITKI